MHDARPQRFPRPARYVGIDVNVSVDVKEKADLPRSARRVVGTPLSRLSILLLLTLLVSLGVGCSIRSSVPIENPRVDAEYDLQRINGAVELCLPRTLRLRYWRYQDRLYSVYIGRLTALEIERLAKQLIRRVHVTFEDECGKATDRPWLGIEIMVAERNLSGDPTPDDPWGDDPLNRTRVELEWSLFDHESDLVWTTTTSAERKVEPLFFTSDHVEAATDFGAVMADALREGFDQIAVSPVVQATLTARH